MRSGKSAAALGLASAFFVLAFSASGAPTSKARFESERLFREGKRLYEAGQYKEACEALASSDELDPAIGTLGLLAACHEKQGDLVLAWKEYLETARRAEAKKDSRAEFAQQQAEALKARLARISIRSAGHEAGLEIRRDDTVVLESELGTQIKVNPGEHRVVARAPGLPEWKTTINLKEGEHRTVEVPVLDPKSLPDAQWIPPKWLIATVGGVGAAGIVAGSISGVFAITNNEASLDKKVCKPTARACNARDAAFTASTVSTVMFSIGGAGLAVGATLFFVARSRSASEAPKKSDSASASFMPVWIGVAPSVGPSGMGALVVGAF